MRWGAEAVSFEGLKPGLAYWQDAAPPLGTGASVAYAEVGRSWVAVGRPVAPPGAEAEAIEAFRRAGRTAGRRVACFCAEAVPPGWEGLPIGEQPWFTPDGWRAAKAAHPRLREQLRQARKKGVVVRVPAAEELAPGAPLRAQVEAMAQSWVAAHHLEPLGFVVALAPFDDAPAHRYLVAERGGEPVAFLSAIPIPAVGGWFIEDVFRSASRPNGTQYAIFDAFMAGLDDVTAPVTLGLAPLSGPLPSWLRAARALTRPLYDFQGLRTFKSRLHPSSWQQVYLAHPPGQRLRALWGALSAFAGGSLVGFAVRSLIRHPSGPPYALFAPLVPWTLLLAVLALAGAAPLLGFATAALWVWVGFDAALATVMYRAARRPSVPRLGLALGLAVVDATCSIRHLVEVGLGSTLGAVSLRSLATAAPTLGSVALLAAFVVAYRHGRERRRGVDIPGAGG